MIDRSKSGQQQQHRDDEACLFPFWRELRSASVEIAQCSWGAGGRTTLMGANIIAVCRSMGTGRRKGKQGQRRKGKQARARGWVDDLSKRSGAVSHLTSQQRSRGGRGWSHSAWVRLKSWDLTWATTRSAGIKSLFYTPSACRCLLTTSHCGSWHAGMIDAPAVGRYTQYARA